MKKIRYRLVYNRKNKLTRQGTALVQVEAYLDKKHIYISTGVYLRPEHWDTATGAVNELNPNHKNLNAFLFECIYNIEKVELELWKRGIPPSLYLIKQNVGAYCSCDTSFQAFAKEYIEKSDRRQTSKDNMQTTLKLLCEFRPDYDWDDLNYSFLKDFEIFLRERGDRVNTIAKHLRQLRTLVNEAIRQGYISQSPFAKYRIKQEDSIHTFLTLNEVHRLEKLSPTDKQLQHTLHAYLFCCYTGLRYSDFVSMDENSMVLRKGKQWLVFRSRKTRKETVLPLYLLGDGNALEILSGYPDIRTFADIGSNREVNIRLRKLSGMAGIRKRMTFHSARHTCATSLVYQGVPITSVQKILGHRKISTTQVYSEVHAATLVKDLSKKRK